MNWFLSWIGGSIGRVAGSGLVTGIFFLAYGATPGQAVADFIVTPPMWLAHPLFKFACIVVGLLLIGFSLRYNVWSKKQQAIDDLAEDLSWAIHNLLNSPAKDEKQLKDWIQAYKDWCNLVSGKLENRAFFTRADQLHFDRLGFVDPVYMTGKEGHDWWLSQLKLKFERLREIINLTQMRRR